MGKTPVSTDHVIQLASQVAAKVALETYEKRKAEDRKETADRRLRNTGLLLRNYRSFKTYTENAVYDAKDVDEEEFSITDLMSDRWKDSDTVVESIKQSVARTVTIVAHIESMLNLYRIFCEQSGNPEELRRWQVIKGLYIDEEAQTIKQLATSNLVSERTIYRDISIATERIAALIFGIDGIR